ncbi:MAG: glycogen debranching protein GlgX [Pseudomonadales bacterium]|jgi:glycogen operon protein|nr:glycogen debranching protein GlgX [Pseudomonadales bacterium]
MTSSYTIVPSRHYPLGSHYDGYGTQFALYSAHAEKVELCLFDDRAAEELQRLELPSYERRVFSGYVEGLRPGAIYGYRVYGPYQPELGRRFNHHKLLLDPYARRVAGKFEWSDLHYAYQLNHPDQDLSFDERDNAALMLKAVVCEPHEIDPLTPLPRHGRPAHTVIYEAHVKGMTMTHPVLPPELRGTLAGLGHEALIAYLKALGITTLELLPVQGFLDEHLLVQKNLRNYWGYNTLTFFAPHQAYLRQGDPMEFRALVQALHEANIEVILDVVFNHTAEGDRLGPTLSFKGIDNLTYYRLQSENQRYYINDTGCGNTLNVTHPAVLQLVMDSLRYWVQVMGVDGFRFDLATILGRERHGFDDSNGFFDALYQDPVLAGARLIAEPWDIGPGGYQLGAFPSGWSEWNDRYRDTVRRFWRGDSGVLPEFARRVHGSSDIFEHSGRRPSASVNFISSHDGFTLQDLVSYRDKHNEANQENNRDGHAENFSENYGVEGPAPFTEINDLRRRQRRNFLTTLILSQGLPMLCAGDELCRTQQGNNNAYCQDNPLSWIDWQSANHSTEAQAQLAFTRRLLAFKRAEPWIWPPRYVHMSQNPQDPVIIWFNRDGEIMQPMHWGQHHTTSLGYLVGEAGFSSSRRMLALFNAGTAPLDFRLPYRQEVPSWTLVLDTSFEGGFPSDDEHDAANANQEVTGHYPLQAQSTVILFANVEPDASYARKISL